MDKREQLIKAGMKLFVEKGFENSSTAQISKEAKVATGTLYLYFKSKEELIDSIYIHVKKNMANAMFKEINHENDTKDLFKQVWFELMTWGFNNKYESKFLERFYGSTYINNKAVRQMESVFSRGTTIFERAYKEKILKNVPINVLKKLTLNIFHCFLDEFLELKKLDKKLLELSWQTYWDSIKR